MKYSLDPKLSFQCTCYIDVFPIKGTKLLLESSLEVRALITEITVKSQNVDPCGSADPLSIPLNTDLIRATSSSKKKISLSDYLSKKTEQTPTSQKPQSDKAVPILYGSGDL